MASGGFTHIEMVGCEGIVAHAEEQIKQLTGDDWIWWVELNYRLGNDPALHGAATHLLYVGHTES